jgi:leucine dehydrogenase
MENHNYKQEDEYNNHKSIYHFEDKTLDFQSFIAIHSIQQGPALGGTRLLAYDNVQNALKDALKLSKAMTYKCAIAGLPFGGGKAVIIADPKNPNILDILKLHAINTAKLSGKFYTGADVGLDQHFVEHMAQFTPYIIGTTKAAGDPSPYASMSAFLCAKVALQHLYGNASPAGRTIIIKGVGKTGKKLAELFYNAGAKVFITDIDTQRIADLIALYPGVRAIKTQDIHTMPCDIYAPCALSSDINDTTIKELKAHIICGTANNQLAYEELADTLFSRGILHIPDYVANAGGLINVADELMPGGYQHQRVLNHLEELQNTCKRILIISNTQGKNPYQTANIMAEQRLQIPLEKPVTI